MRKASKEEGGEKRVEKKKQTFENPKCGPNKKKKARKNFEKVQNEEISKQIEHDEAEQWFTIDLPGGQGQAFLQYSIEDDGKIDLWHTEVPEAARGAGIGGQLAKAAIDWAAGRKNSRDQAVTVMMQKERIPTQM